MKIENRNMKHKIQPVKFNKELLRKDIIEKRLILNRMSLRKAAEEMEVPAATLSRVERGNDFDIGTFCKILRWLAEQPNRYFTH